jgi:hypothetical protein
VRPCLRIAPEDGFPLRETVAEVLQYVEIPAGELRKYGLTKPEGMPNEQTVTLEGGLTLVFDEFGKLRYRVGDGVLNDKDPDVRREHDERLHELWIRGAFRKGASARSNLGRMHRLRALGRANADTEAW